MSLLTGRLEVREGIRGFLSDGRWHLMDELCAVVGRSIPFEYAVHWWDRRKDRIYPEGSVKTGVDAKARAARRLILAQRVRHMILDGERLEATGFGRSRKVRRV